MSSKIVTISISLTFFLLLIACEKDEETTQCYECKRIIQTFDADNVLFLRQDDQFTKCGITETEMRKIESEGSYTEPITSGSNSGGKKEFTTTCTKSK